nr:MAG TPA: hypothetical protein [Caudoviricetes sp.]
MARKVDITEKLTFDGNPCIVIKGKELEVNADAPTVLKVMSMTDGGSSAKEVLGMYELIFPEKARKELDKFKLPFLDLVTVVQEAINVITGAEEEEDSEQGEQ